MTPDVLDRQLDELLFQSAPPYSRAEMRSACAMLMRSTMQDCAALCDALAYNGRLKWTDRAAILDTEELAATLHAALAALR